MQMLADSTVKHLHTAIAGGIYPAFSPDRLSLFYKGAELHLVRALSSCSLHACAGPASGQEIPLGRA
jgi:hypothetical protein